MNGYSHYYIRLKDSVLIVKITSLYRSRLLYITYHAAMCRLQIFFNFTGYQSHEGSIGKPGVQEPPHAWLWIHTLRKSIYTFSLLYTDREGEAEGE